MLKLFKLQDKSAINLIPNKFYGGHLFKLNDSTVHRVCLFRLINKLGRRLTIYLNLENFRGVFFILNVVNKGRDNFIKI